MNYGLYHQKRSRVSVLNSLQYFARWRRLFVSDLVTRNISGLNPPPPRARPRRREAASCHLRIRSKAAGDIHRNLPRLIARELDL